MKRHVPGLYLERTDGDRLLEGSFLVQIERAFYCHHPHKPFLDVRFSVLSPQQLLGQRVSGRLYCTRKAMWKLNWFLRDFGYDADLFERDEVDEKALLGLRGVLRTSRSIWGRRVFQNLEAFAPAGEWEQAESPRKLNEQNPVIDVGL